MAKISKDEYDVLKGLKDTWRWIARDRDMGSYIFPEGGLWVYEYKPEKPSNFWSMGEDGEEGESVIFPYDDLFQFIHWEDEEPYNIQELIEEYEDEIKGTEVKSKQELIEKWEMAIESAEFYGKGKEEEVIGYMKDFVSDLKQIDEPEVLSQEWIERNTSPVDEEGRLYVWKRDLQNLLVPKQEKVKVPQLVADWLDDNIERYETVYSFIISLVEVFGDTVPEKVWTYASENPDTMARAYLDGYKVEEEQKYRARLKVITNEFIASYLRTQSSDAEDRLKTLEIGCMYIHEDYRHLSEFTEVELKRLNIWDSEQWEVEEVEENGKD